MDVSLPVDGNVAGTLSFCHMPADQPYFSTREVAEALDVSMTSVRRWAKAGTLPTVKLPSGRWKVKREVLLAIMNRSDAA